MSHVDVREGPIAVGPSPNCWNDRVYRWAGRLRRPRVLCWIFAGAAIGLVVPWARSPAPTRPGDGLARPAESASGATGPGATDWVRRGSEAIRGRRLREAEAALERAKQLDPSSAPARLGLAWIHLLRRRRAEALAEFAALAELGPLDFDRALLWCQTRCSLWDPEKVVPQLRELLRADPDDRGVRLTLAEGCRRSGQLSEALAVLAVLDESDPDALAIRARLAIERGDRAAAAAMLSHGPADHADLAELRGELALSRHDGPAAEAAYRRALAGQPDHRRRLDGLAQALRLSGRGWEARPLLARIRLLDILIDRLCGAAEMTRREDASVLRDLGAACEALELLAEARVWYDLALARDPLDRETQLALHRLRKSRPEPSPRIVPPDGPPLHPARPDGGAAR